MPRSVNSVASRKRRKKIIKAAKGYFGARKNVWTVAKNAVDRAMAFAYVGRKLKKRAYRRLWIARINAGCRQNGMSYSRFIAGLNAAGVEVGRKILADMAVHDPASFSALVAQAKAAL